MAQTSVGDIDCPFLLIGLAQTSGRDAAEAMARLDCCSRRWRRGCQGMARRENGHARRWGSAASATYRATAAGAGSVQGTHRSPSASVPASPGARPTTRATCTPQRCSSVGSGPSPGNHHGVGGGAGRRAASRSGWQPSGSRQRRRWSAMPGRPQQPWRAVPGGRRWGKASRSTTARSASSDPHATVWPGDGPGRRERVGGRGPARWIASTLAGRETRGRSGQLGKGRALGGVPLTTT